MSRLLSILIKPHQVSTPTSQTADSHLPQSDSRELPHSQNKLAADCPSLAELDY